MIYSSKFLSAFLLAYAPSFCWMTADDLYRMTTFVMEEVELESFKVALSKLVVAELFEIRILPLKYIHEKTGPRPYQYLNLKRSKEYYDRHHQTISNRMQILLLDECIGWEHDVCNGPWTQEKLRRFMSQEGAAPDDRKLVLV